jgi:hypothetical protein
MSLRPSLSPVSTDSIESAPTQREKLSGRSSAGLINEAGPEAGPVEVTKPKTFFSRLFWRKPKADEAPVDDDIETGVVFERRTWVRRFFSRGRSGDVASELNNVSERSNLFSRLFWKRRQADVLPPPDPKFRKLGWKKMAVNLFVETIAIGALSIPNSFSDLGMLMAIFLNILCCFGAIYTSWIIGQVQLKYRDQIRNYADAVGLMFGLPGKAVTGFMIVSYLIFLTGSHVLIFVMAAYRISGDEKICALALAACAVVGLFLLALPPTFSEFAILGYVDLASILVVLITTMAATGFQKQHLAQPVDWSWLPPKETGFLAGCLACTNIVFAYSFAVVQFSFMAEMHTPSDYKKAVVSLGIGELLIYT